MIKLLPKPAHTRTDPPQKPAAALVALRALAEATNLNPGVVLADAVATIAHAKIHEIIHRKEERLALEVVMQPPTPNLGALPLAMPELLSNSNLRPRP